MVLMGRTAHLSPFARPSRADRTLATDFLAMLGILNLADADYVRISGSQRQLALIARALPPPAPLLIMDEPTASLDLVCPTGAPSGRRPSTPTVEPGRLIIGCVNGRSRWGGS